MTLTETERIILENTDEKYKYIARDEGGHLCVYEEKPYKNTVIKIWCVGDAFGWITAFNHLFQSIQWEDEEPLQFRNKKGEFML